MKWITDNKDILSVMRSVDGSSSTKPREAGSFQTRTATISSR